MDGSEGLLEGDLARGLTYEDKHYDIVGLDSSNLNRDYMASERGFEGVGVIWPFKIS